jgi:tol-pal system protein YbgF
MRLSSPKRLPSPRAARLGRGVACAVLLATALLASGCATTSAEDDPLQVRIDDMDTRLGKIERVAGGQNMLELSQRIDALQAEVRALRGQVEVLENGNEALRKQQRDLYADIERRLAALEGGARAPLAPAAGLGGSVGAAAPLAAGGAGTGAPPAIAGRAETPEQLYGRAFDALKAGNYSAAIAGMREFLAAHPQHDLADNAQYWLGEAHYVTRDYDAAIADFGALLAKWPESNKAPDAQLKLGYAQFESKRFAAARQALTLVTTRYPGTEAARLAQERLRRIPPDAR